MRGLLASKIKLAEILGPAGVDASHEAVVISGAGLTKESALAFVMLEKLGQKKVTVFMDPLEKWTQPGFALTKDTTVVAPPKGPRRPLHTAHEIFREFPQGRDHH